MKINTASKQIQISGIKCDMEDEVNQQQEDFSMQ